MSPEPLVTRAYLEAVIRVFAPWEGGKGLYPELDKGAERVRTARRELDRLTRPVPARQSVPEGPGEVTRWDLPPVPFDGPG